MAGRDVQGRVLLVLAVGVVLVASLTLAGSYPLIDPDEGRNAEVGREMYENGDLVIPHLAGMPYLDKPPALFWLQAASFRVLGVSPQAARLPAAVAASLILWLVGALALRAAGTRRMLIAVGLLACAPLFFVLSAYVIFDMLLAACVAVVWVLIAREAERPEEPPGVLRRLALFVAIAAGVLTKGPVMLAWAFGGSVAAAFLMRSLVPLRWAAWWPGWIAFFAIAGGWFAIATARHPEYPHYAFVDETFRRMTTGAFKREQPFWFVPAVLAAGALPWSIAAPWGRRLGPASRVALAFILFSLVFFTLSRSKLVTYLLPVIPCMAWIAAEAWENAWRSRRAGVGIAITLAIVAVAGLVFGWNRAAWGTIIEPHVIEAGMRSTRLLGIILGIAAVVAMAGAWTRRGAWPLIGALAFTPTVLLAAWPSLMEHADTQSGAPLARAVHDMGREPVVRYEYAYSPGTDFLLGRSSRLVSDLAYEFTSNYQIYYRDTLVQRGQWRPEPLAERAGVDVVVRPSRRDDLPPLTGWEPFFTDRRFTAYRKGPPSR